MRMKIIYFYEKDGKDKRISLGEIQKIVAGEETIIQLKNRLDGGEIIETTDGGKVWAEEL